MINIINELLLVTSYTVAMQVGSFVAVCMSLASLSSTSGLAALTSFLEMPCGCRMDVNIS